MPVRNVLSHTLTNVERIRTGWPRFDESVYLSPKYLINIFGTAGSFKSLFALNLVRRLSKQRVPCLYITLDTTIEDQAQRWWSVVTNTRIDRIATTPYVARYWMSRAETAIKAEGSLPPEWVHRAMDVNDIPDLLYAQAEFSGQIPRVVVIDSLRWIVPDSSYEGYIETLLFLKNQVAAPTGSTVITIHHTKKNVKSGQRAYLHDVEYAGGKEPDTVISMNARARLDRDPRVSATILKARASTKSDASGSVYVAFRVNREKGGRMDETR